MKKNNLLQPEKTPFLLRWGVIGAAIASAIAFTVGGIQITVALWKHPMISPRGMRLKPDKDILKIME